MKESQSIDLAKRVGFVTKPFTPESLARALEEHPTDS
jgi:hypothetical protein